MPTMRESPRPRLLLLRGQIVLMPRPTACPGVRPESRRSPMVYALHSTPVDPALRAAVARAIATRQSLAAFVERDLILHVRDTRAGQACFCIYCEGAVRPARANRPVGRVPAHDWYFRHVDNPACMGMASVLGDGIANPRRQGCYERLGCEAGPDGQPTRWHRQQCKTIVGGRTYCHLATLLGCVP